MSPTDENAQRRLGHEIHRRPGSEFLWYRVYIKYILYLYRHIPGTHFQNACDEI